MSPRDSFDDILDSAIDAMRAGASRDQALASAGGSAATMGGLLDTAQSLATPPRVPAPTRLGDHYDILRAAVERAQMTRGQMIPSDEPVRTPWWRRRLHFASFAVPAGLVAALALFGVVLMAQCIHPTSERLAFYRRQLAAVAVVLDELAFEAVGNAIVRVEHGHAHVLFPGIGPAGWTDDPMVAHRKVVPVDHAPPPILRRRRSAASRLASGLIQPQRAQ